MKTKIFILILWILVLGIPGSTQPTSGISGRPGTDRSGNDQINNERLATQYSSFSLDEEYIDLYSAGIGLLKADAEKDAINKAWDEVWTRLEQKESYKKIIGLVFDERRNLYIEKVSSEAQKSDGIHHCMNVLCRIHLDQLRRDSERLSYLLDYTDFLVLSNPLNHDPTQDKYYAYTERFIQSVLCQLKFSYLDPQLYLAILDLEPDSMLENSAISYFNKASLYANTELLIIIQNIEISSDYGRKRVSIDLDLSDASTRNGLGTVTIVGEVQGNDIKGAINDALFGNNEQGFSKLLGYFVGYMVDWTIKGAPYCIKLYDLNEQEVQSLKNELTQEDYGFENIESSDAYGKYHYLRFYSTSKPETVKDLVRKAATGLNINIESRGTYGRAISFAPPNVPIPEIIEKNEWLRRHGFL